MDFYGNLVIDYIFLVLCITSFFLIKFSEIVCFALNFFNVYKIYTKVSLFRVPKVESIFDKNILH